MLKRNCSGTPKMLNGNSRSTPMGINNHDVDGGDDIDTQLVLEISGVFYVLEPEIFFNILSRLPLKSLSQCRWVCKSWYKLIRTPIFAKIQSEWAVNNNSHYVFFWTCEKDFYLVDDQVFDHPETSATVRNVELNEFKLNFHKNDFEVVGYTNGLICFAVYLDDSYDCCASPFYICNPITGEHITIPKSPNNNRHKCINERSAFGFDPTTDEYKVMCIFHYVDEDGEYSSLEGEVYTLGSSDWRKIEDVPQFSNSGLCGVHVSGNIHWISYLSDSIIAFNVGAEKFHVIQPPTLAMLQSGTKGLTVVDKHLCFLHIDSESKPYEIWVMKDYGVQSSWVKKYSSNSDLLEWFQFRPNNVITLKNGEFLVLCKHTDKYMLIYNPKRNNFRRIKVNRRMESIFYMVMQVGSLLSPKDVGIPGRGEKV